MHDYKQVEEIDDKEALKRIVESWKSSKLATELQEIQENKNGG